MLPISLQNSWTTIIDDLGSEENALPKELRAAIISIGIFVLKEDLNVSARVRAMIMQR